METQKFSFKILGMTCASCSRINERNLSAVPGVQYASVNLGTNTAFVIADGTVTMDDLEKAVIKGGYRISLEMDDNAERKRCQKKESRSPLNCAAQIVSHANPNAKTSNR